MIVLIISLVVVYFLCAGLCALSAAALFGEHEAKMVMAFAFVPIVNIVLAVVIIMIFRTLYKENKNAAKQNEAKKS